MVGVDLAIYLAHQGDWRTPRLPGAPIERQARAEATRSRDDARNLPIVGLTGCCHTAIGIKHDDRSWLDFVGPTDVKVFCAIRAREDYVATDPHVAGNLEISVEESCGGSLASYSGTAAKAFTKDACACTVPVEIASCHARKTVGASFAMDALTNLCLPKHASREKTLRSISGIVEPGNARKTVRTGFAMDTLTDLRLPKHASRVEALSEGSGIVEPGNARKTVRLGFAMHTLTCL
jgi:hypothetical protein